MGRVVIGGPRMMHAWPLNWSSFTRTVVGVHMGELSQGEDFLGIGVSSSWKHNHHGRRLSTPAAPDCHCLICPALVQLS